MGFFEAIFKVGFGVAFGLLVHNTFLPMISLFWQTGQSILIDLGAQPLELNTKIIFFVFSVGINGLLFLAIPALIYAVLGRFFELDDDDGDLNPYAFAVYLYLVWAIIYKVMIS